MGDLRIRGWRGDADMAPLLELARAVVAADRLPFAWTEERVREDVMGAGSVDPARDILLAERDGGIVGALWLREAVRVGAHQIDHEGFVHPEARRAGVGGALFDAAAARAREIGARFAGDGLPIRLAVQLRDEDEDGHRLAEARGFTPWRWFALMARDFKGVPVPAPVPVPGLGVRPLTLETRRPAFDALNEAFRDHFGSRAWTDEMFVQFFSGPDHDDSLWRVAWDGDQVAGVSDAEIDERETASLGLRQGWIHTFGVRRPWRGRGVARWLLTETLAELDRRGLDRAVLWVDLDNPTGALGLYESVGFRPLLRTARWTRMLEVEE